MKKIVALCICGVLLMSTKWLGIDGRSTALNTATNSNTDTVAVCPPPPLSGLAFHCFAPEDVPRFNSLEEAQQRLEPQGGGTILLQPGGYQTTLSWEGDWVIRGLNFPEAVILVPREKDAPSSVGGVDSANSPALFTVKSGSSLRLENLTLRDDSLPPPNEFVEAWAIGVRVKSGAQFAAQNVLFQYWVHRPVLVERGGGAWLSETWFTCPSVGNNKGPLMLDGRLYVEKSRFEHCDIATLRPTSETPTSTGLSVSEFIDNEFFHSRLSSSSTVTRLERDRFVNIRPEVSFGLFGASPIDIIFIGGAEARVIDNVFAIRDSFTRNEVSNISPIDEFGAISLGLVKAIETASRRVELSGNEFRGFQIGVDLNSFGNEDIRLSDNVFEANRISIHFNDRLQGTIRLENNRFASTVDCEIFVTTTNRGLPGEGQIELVGTGNVFQNQAPIICPEDVILSLPEGFIAN